MNENVINNGIMAKAKNNMASNRGCLLASACGGCHLCGYMLA
jgi:uncharacterized Fe-S cluster-containing MiaB family protein